MIIDIICNMFSTFGAYLMLASNTCMVVQESNETLSSSNCTALINSLVLPITYGKGERGGVVRTRGGMGEGEGGRKGREKGRGGKRRRWKDKGRGKGATGRRRKEGGNGMI